MPIPIILPKFGFTLETADIVQWLKQDGDTVRAGDPICEVTTDKVNMEVEAPESGTLMNPLYAAGATVPVTEVIAYLLRPGEARPSKLPTAAPASESVLTAADIQPATTESAGTSVSPVAQRIAEAGNVDLSQIKGSGRNNRIVRRDVEGALTRPDGKVRATPAARHLAKEAGIDLLTVSGSGPRGRIQSADVEAAGQAVTPVEQVPPPASSPLILSGEQPRIVKMEGMRRTIANRLQKSFQTAPHIFFDAAIDTGGIEKLRQSLKARDEKLSVTTILVKACAGVLMRHPWLNATLDGEEIALWPTANIGVAVALEAGLVVPVVRNADRLSMHAIQTSVDELAKRARENTLKVPDMVDGTFTISNLGMFGVDRFTAIINPPQVAILAVGRTQQQFVPDANGQPVLRSFMTVTLSADHRVVDGAQAANFLQDLRTVLEEPALLAW
ncbi:MAG: 2-oxo acid dehydrogenase subunit E2 [Chloroflexi bacterium]|nr:2-oxo acid dehydrogenase subunit E2 [Chloroflexota bacterium]MCC6891563.1 2-oxo acid dehydrogenase subunit E2 [Anaerolineae bacterium]